MGKVSVTVVVFLVIIGLYGSGKIERWIDSTGRIPHKSETIITAQANWFVGESKNCNSVPDKADAGYAFADLECDVNGPKHQVTAIFWGRRNQPEYDLVLWRCTRRETDFTCKEDGWFRPGK